MPKAVTGDVLISFNAFITQRWWSMNLTFQLVIEIRTVVWTWGKQKGNKVNSTSPWSKKNLKKKKKKQKTIKIFKAASVYRKWQTSGNLIMNNGEIIKLKNKEDSIQWYT